MHPLIKAYATLKEMKDSYFPAERRDELDQVLDFIDEFEKCERCRPISR